MARTISGVESRSGPDWRDAATHKKGGDPRIAALSFFSRG
jgi:hypothetical protein